MTTMTNGGLLAGVRRLQLGTSQRIAVLTGGVTAAAVALFVIVVAPLSAAATAVSLPWPLWAVAFALAEILVVYVQWKRDSHGFSVTDLVLAAGLFLTSPATLVTARSEEHTSELQSQFHLVCRLLL